MIERPTEAERCPKCRKKYEEWWLGASSQLICACANRARLGPGMQVQKNTEQMICVLKNHSNILRFNESAHAAGMCVNIVVVIARFRFLVPEVVWPSKGAQMDVGKGLADEGVVGGKIGGDRQVQCPVRIVMSVVVTEMLHVLHQNRLDGMFYELWTSRTQSFHEPSIL